MYKLRPFLPLKVIEKCILQLNLFPYYAIEAWCSACKTELDKIFVLQKRAMRLMTYNDKYPTVCGPLISSDPNFFELEMLKVSDNTNIKCQNLYSNVLIKWHL